MALPNFFCVGTQKAGTTTLFNILKQHPEICLPPNKEAWFFHKDDKYQRGIRWYEKEYFFGYCGEKAIGDISPDYMYFEKVPGRIRRDLGEDIRFIFIFRNPADRAYSHYQMSVFRGLEKKSFQEAIKLEAGRIAKGFFEKIHFSYISRGMYYNQVIRFLDYFPREQMLFLIFEENIKANIGSTVETIFDFLDVNKLELDLCVDFNPSVRPRSEYLRDLIKKPNRIKAVAHSLVPFPGVRSKIRKFIERLNKKEIRGASLDPAMKTQIIDNYFKDDILRLERLLGRDLSLWYTF